MTLPIFSERLTLRSMRPDDLEDILEIVSHPSVSRITKKIGTSKSSISKYIARQRSYQSFEMGRYVDLVIVRNEDNKVMRLVGLMCEDHQQGLIGWALGVDYRGNGYATEAAKALISYAFSELGLHRTYAKTSNINQPSWKVMERVGMRKEAHFKEAELRDGEWIDNLVYAVLVSEWQTDNK